MSAILIFIVSVAFIIVSVLSIINVYRLGVGESSMEYFCFLYPAILIPLSLAHSPEFISYLNFLQSDGEEFCFIYNISMAYFMLLPVSVLHVMHAINVYIRATATPTKTSTLNNLVFSTFPDYWRQVTGTVYTLMFLQLLFGIGMAFILANIEVRKCEDYNEVPLFIVVAGLFISYFFFYHRYRHYIVKHPVFEVTGSWYRPFGCICTMSLLFSLCCLLIVLEDGRDENTRKSIRKGRYTILTIFSCLVKSICLICAGGYTMDEDDLDLNKPSKRRLDCIHKRRIVEKFPRLQLKVTQVNNEAQAEWRAHSL